VLGFKKKGKKAPEKVVSENEIKTEESGGSGESDNVFTYKSLVFSRYMSKNQFANANELEKSAIKTNVVTLAIHSLSLAFCILAVTEIWVKNSDVGLHVQRIDGVKLEVVNDARSRILLRKALQSGLTREQIKELNLE